MTLWPLFLVDLNVELAALRHDWQGETLPLSRAWVKQTVAPLPEADQAEGSLALLAAVAPHQIDAAIIQALRAERGTDARLVSIVAWASFQAARRILSWLPVPVQHELSFSHEKR